MNDRHRSDGNGGRGPHEGDRWLLTAMKELPRESASERFTEEVLKRIEEGASTPRVRPASKPFVPWRIALPLAATLVLAAFLAPLLIRDDGGSGGSPSADALRQSPAIPGAGALPRVGGARDAPVRNVGLESLLRDQQSLAAELEALRKSVDPGRRVIYLDGNASADIVIDVGTLVELIEERRAEAAGQPLRQEPGASSSPRRPGEPMPEPAPEERY